MSAIYSGLINFPAPCTHRFAFQSPQNPPEDVCICVHYNKCNIVMSGQSSVVSDTGVAMCNTQ